MARKERLQYEGLDACLASAEARLSSALAYDQWTLGRVHSSHAMTIGSRRVRATLGAPARQAGSSHVRVREDAW
eukprot:6206079-Pleurochrysis_carterae.AAC.3